MLLLVLFTVFVFTQAEWVKQMENDGLYEGDIVLDPGQKQDLANGKNGFATIRTGHWPHGKPISYRFENSLGSSGRRAVQNAIATYQKYTCLRFKPYAGERAHISFFSGGGCYSPIGYRGGMNRISLGSGCRTTGIAIHEIGHSLGIFHEQARPDRDRYVKIIWNNIQSGKSGNFRKQGSNINSYGTPYDYDSIMHYGAKTFAKGFLIFKGNTIETLDKKYQGRIGQRKRLSDVDIKQINLMYCS